MNEKIFPTVLMALDYLAAIPYAVKGDVKMAVYWVLRLECSRLP